MHMKLRGERSYELRDMTRTIDCAMGLTLRMQKFSASDGDRFFMTFIESYGFFFLFTMSDERAKRWLLFKSHMQLLLSITKLYIHRK